MLHDVCAIDSASYVMSVLRFHTFSGSLLPFAAMLDPGPQVPSTTDVAAVLFNIGSLCHVC